jgi:hypothetical protein
MVDPLGLARNDNMGDDSAAERTIEMSFRALSRSEGRQLRRQPRRSRESPRRLELKDGMGR